MNRVAIVGVGLIGGSFGLALREAGFEGEIVGVSSQAALETGMRVGAISGSATLEEAATTADLIYLAQPVDRILETLETLGRLAGSDCLITDAGSTKAAIVRKAAECVVSACFLGGHPLAGKEQRGAESADADLFRGRLYVLTPTAAKTGAAEVFRSWLLRMGARILDVPAAEHDAVVALTSHLPQLIAVALANTLAQQKNGRAGEIFGPGLLDMTRLALSPADVWQSIFATNKSEILVAMDAFHACLDQLRGAVVSDDLAGFFDSAASLALQIRNPSCTNTSEVG